MKKYAGYNYSPKTLSWLRRTNILYFFLAWNAFGLCAYEWYTRGRDKNSDWGKMSGTQKYISMTVNPDDEVRVIKIKGITKQEEEDITAEKYISVANK